MAREWRFALGGALAVTVLGGLIAWGYWTVHLEEAINAGAQANPVQGARTAAPVPSAKNLQPMQLAAQYAGPLKDTVVQRWQDPDEGTLCYLYLPIIVQHSPPTPAGYVQYGANGIGSISCVTKH